MFFLWVQYNLLELVTEVRPSWDALRSVHSRAVQWALRMLRGLGLLSDGFCSTSSTVGMQSTFDLSAVPTRFWFSANRTEMAGNVTITI